MQANGFQIERNEQVKARASVFQSERKHVTLPHPPEVAGEVEADETSELLFKEVARRLGDGNCPELSQVMFSICCLHTFPQANSTISNKSNNYTHRLFRQCTASAGTPPRVTEGDQTTTRTHTHTHTHTHTLEST